MPCAQHPGKRKLAGLGCEVSAARNPCWGLGQREDQRPVSTNLVWREEHWTGSQIVSDLWLFSPFPVSCGKAFSQSQLAAGLFFGADNQAEEAQEGTPGSVDLGRRAWRVSSAEGCGRQNSKMTSNVPTLPQFPFFECETFNLLLTRRIGQRQRDFADVSKVPRQ